MRSTVVLSMLAALVPAATAAAQQPRLPPVDTAVVAVRLNDGSEVIGRVVARDDSSLTLVVGDLRVVVPSRAVASWRAPRGEIVGGRFRPADPNPTRLFFGPTARTLPQGEGYFADYYLFFPMVGFGVADAITLAGGISIFPGTSGQLVYVAPKLRVAHRARLDAAVGGILFTTTGGGGQVGAAYGALTLGDENNALTVVGGMTEADGRWSSTPGFLIGGETRVGRSAKLLGEAWAFPASNVVPAIFGVRFFGSRLAVDFGLIYPLGARTEGFPFAPWLDFTVHF